MASPDNTINWGIMGTGNMAARMVRCIRNKGGRVRAVGSRSIENARRFSNEHEIDKAFESYEALAEEAGVDVVYVATTNDQHFDNAMYCIRNRLAVLCEKPLTTSAEKTRVLVESAREAGTLLVEAMWMRFQPFVSNLNQLIADDVIGTVTFVGANFGYPVEEMPTTRWYDPNLGGGSVLDIGVYPLALAHHLLGSPVTSLATGVLASTGVDAQCAVSSQHRNGAISALTCSFMAATSAEAIIAGSKGRIFLPSPFFHRGKLMVETKRTPDVRSIDCSYGGDGLECQIAEVHRCLRESLPESPCMPHRDTIAVAQWCDGILGQIGVQYPD